MGELGGLVAERFLEESRRANGGRYPLKAYTVLPMVVDGRGQVALLCARHDGLPVMLIPGTDVNPGAGFPVDQRGLTLDMIVDAAGRHDREQHRAAV